MLRGGFRGILSSVAAVCSACTLLTGAVRAQGPVSYELRLSEDAWLTVDPQSQHFAQQAAARNQHELFSMRDMPYVQLMNTSPLGRPAEIVRFSMTIGNLQNNQHHFDWVKIIDHSPGITWQIVMPDTINGGVRSDAIDILFTGFTPGKLIRFQTDIDNDQGNIDIFTDYRQVLFQLGGGGNFSNNSLVAVHFREPGLPTAVSATHLPNFPQLGPTNLGFRLISECGPESVHAYTHVGGAFIIPEPGTLALLACGMVGLVAFARRRATRVA